MKEYDSYLRCLDGHGLKPTQHVVIARLGEKILKLWIDGEIDCEFPFSFSKLPLSCKENSLGTPWGLHEVCEKYGDAAPNGMVFKGRRATGECWYELSDTGPDQPCCVTTRILRLNGLERGLNAGPGIDSYDRYIYIHGTNHPQKFPNNISAGCLLMLDDALSELYEKTPPGTHVLIVR